MVGVMTAGASEKGWLNGVRRRLFRGPATTAFALLLALAAVAAVSAWAFDSHGPTAVTAWSAKPWPPTASAWHGRCDKVASPRGSDHNPGTRRAPYRSAQALGRALAPGQTGCLRAGTYSADGGDPVLALAHSGRPGAPITIRSYPGERARLYGITQVQAGTSWIILSGLRFEGDGSQNTIKVYGSDITIANSDITNRRRGLSCLILGSGAEGFAVRPLIRGNRFHDCGNPANGNKDHAIYASNTMNAQIVENVFSNSAAYAIQFYPDAQGTQFERNLVDGGGVSIRGGVLIGGDGRDASSDNVVAHNVIAYPATYGVSSNWEGPEGRGNVVASNCLWKAKLDNIDPRQAGFSASGNIVADPHFRNRRRGDYRMPADDPCWQAVR
jgi:hypothetical protein